MLDTPLIIFTLLAVSLATVYPLCLCFLRGVARTDFYHRQLLLAGALGALGAGGLGALQAGPNLLISALIWELTLLSMAAFYWKRERISTLLVSVPSLFGLIVWFQVCAQLIFPSVAVFVSELIGGGVLALGLFGLTLTWSTRKRPEAPLPAAGYLPPVLAGSLVVRAVWDSVYLFRPAPDITGPAHPLWSFILTPRGNLLGAALLFGLLVPAVTVVLQIARRPESFPRRVWQLQVPLLVSLLLAEVLFTWYLYQFGLPL